MLSQVMSERIYYQVYNSRPSTTEEEVANVLRSFPRILKQYLTSRLLAAVVLEVLWERDKYLNKKEDV